MTDKLEEFQPTLTSGPKNIAAPSQSDSVDLANYAKCIYVGTSGAVKINDLNGNAATFENLAAGVWHAIPCSRVWSTGTDATDILIGYD